MSSPPHAVLDRLVHQRVEVHLKDGRRVEGRLAGCDDHLNLVLDEGHEVGEAVERRLGRVVLRGSNITSVTIGGAPVARSPT